MSVIAVANYTVTVQWQQPLFQLSSPSLLSLLTQLHTITEHNEGYHWWHVPQVVFWFWPLHLSTSFLFLLLNCIQIQSLLELKRLVHRQKIILELFWSLINHLRHFPSKNFILWIQPLNCEIVFCDCLLGLFGVWTICWTKTALWRSHLGS